MTEQCRFAMLADVKGQSIGPAMEALGQQAAQQHAAEQVLPLAASWRISCQWRRSSGESPDASLISWSASTLAVFNK
jgi:hypothetical protein